MQIETEPLRLVHRNKVSCHRYIKARRYHHNIWLHCNWYLLLF